MTREAIQLRYRMCVAGLLVILAAACALMYHFHVNGTAAHIRRCTQSISVSATPTRNGRSLGVANNSFLESQSDSVNADGDLTGGYDYNISYTYGGRSYHISEYSRERRTGSSMALYINPGNPKEYYIPGISVTVEDARRHFLYFCIAAPCCSLRESASCALSARTPLICWKSRKERSACGKSRCSIGKNDENRMALPLLINPFTVRTFILGGFIHDQ